MNLLISVLFLFQRGNSSMDVWQDASDPLTSSEILTAVVFIAIIYFTIKVINRSYEKKEQIRKEVLAKKKEKDTRERLVKQKELARKQEELRKVRATRELEKPKNGFWQEKYNNGQLETECIYKNGKKHGVFKSWHENGQLKEELNFKDGEQNGLDRVWY